MTQHDDELRDTRRRWRELHDKPDVHAELDIRLGGVSDDLYDYWQATYDLAKAYYEQFASDDEAPADADWMDALAESVTDRPRVLAWITWHPSTGIQEWKVETQGNAAMPAQAVRLRTDMTRGQVRRLLTALGIEVRQ